VYSFLFPRHRVAAAAVREPGASFLNLLFFSFFLTKEQAPQSFKEFTLFVLIASL
jgi:hypothetical protein